MFDFHHINKLCPSFPYCEDTETTSLGGRHCSFLFLAPQNICLDIEDGISYFSKSIGKPQKSNNFLA